MILRGLAALSRELSDAVDDALVTGLLTAADVEHWSRLVAMVEIEEEENR